MVSLPFSDHCDPLCTSEEIEFLTRYLQCELDHQNWKYLEIRPLNGGPTKAGKASGFQPIAVYSIHRIDLRQTLQDLFHTFDKDSIQRRVRRAERSGLVEKCGRSEELLQDFFRLSVLTRRRHRLPPQPYAWFRNLIQCFGDALEIRAAYMGNIPVASILTLRFKETAYYKYGSSDARFHYLGAMPFLLWNAISEAKTSGAAVFDLGRTDPIDLGLMTFKNNWVREPQPLVYWKFPTSPGDATRFEWKINLMKRIFSYTPNRLLTVAGRLIYPHIG
jgi:Acetyltransferase (GNAT) domain